MKNYEIVTSHGIDTVEGRPCKFAELPNMKFFIHKVNNRYYSLSEVSTGLEVFNDITIKGVKNKLLEFLKTHDKSILYSCVNSSKTVEQYREYINKKDKLLNEFKSTFGFEAPICPLTNSLDVIALDRLLHTPDGISTSNFIKNKYGKTACRIVQDFISI